MGIVYLGEKHVNFFFIRENYHELPKLDKYCEPLKIVANGGNGLDKRCKLILKVRERERVL